MVMKYHSSFKLTENCRCYIWQGRGNNCNTVLLPGLLRGDRQHVLVDPGHIRNELGEPCYDSLTRALQSDGFSMEEVGLVIGTHCHLDHIEATELVVKEGGALFTLSAEEDEFYRTTGRMFFEAFGGRAPGVDPYFYMKEGDLSLGTGGDKAAIKVLLTPGHSPGSISLYLEGERILLTGDVVFAGSVGRTDFPGGSHSLLRQSIERLSQLDVEYIVPGHSTQAGSIIAGSDQVRRNFYGIKMFV
ncbi:MAG: MBL fold metallo-hydrolase [Dehalococcoidia bacterium]